jgi:hypothetical protein
VDQARDAEAGLIAYAMLATSGVVAFMGGAMLFLSRPALARLAGSILLGSALMAASVTMAGMH